MPNLIEEATKEFKAMCKSLTKIQDNFSYDLDPIAHGDDRIANTRRAMSRAKKQLNIAIYEIEREN